MKIKFITLAVAGVALIAGSAVAASYTVQQGDWLSAIAKSTGKTTAQLAELNPQITDINKIFPGQVLNVGDGVGNEATTTTTTAAPVVAAEPVVAETTTHCAKCDNVINGNPLYRPMAGHFYSLTDLATTDQFNAFGLNEELGFGITDWLAVSASTAASWDSEHNTTAWDNWSFGVNARYLDEGNWKGDVYGNIMQNGIMDTGTGFYTADYNWRVGTKIGYTSCDWTLAAKLEYNYVSYGFFAWDAGLGRSYTVGLMGQYVLDEDWNLAAEVDYVMPDYTDGNLWTGKLALNYNLTNNMFLGLYGETSIDNEGNWPQETGIGLQFGVDF